MTQVINGRRVLLLRSGDDSGEDQYGKIFNDAGFNTYQVPILCFTHVNLDALREKITLVDQYSCLVFTSQRAVEAVGKCSEGAELTLWREKKVYVVGETTQKAAEELGLNVHGAESGNAENLLHLITNDGLSKSEPVLFPCGNLRRETLPAGLRAAGYTVDELTVYETSQQPNLEENITKMIHDKGSPDFVCFFSPSGVRYTSPVLTRLDLVNKTKMISMGPSTSKALNDCHLHLTQESEKPTARSLLQAVIDADARDKS